MVVMSGIRCVDDRLNLVIHAYENRLIEIPSHFEMADVNGC